MLRAPICAARQAVRLPVADNIPPVLSSFVAAPMRLLLGEVHTCAAGKHESRRGGGKMDMKCIEGLFDGVSQMAS